MIKQKGSSPFLIRLINGLFGLRLYTLEEIEKTLLLSLNGGPKSPDYTIAFDAAYYQGLHERSSAFQQNNWLLDELEEIIERSPAIITELACGNGLFSRKVAAYCSKVNAIDWAEAPDIKQLPENVVFLKKNIVTDELPDADLVCSGDFLEHLPTEVLEKTVCKIVDCAPLGYHKIACYDDEHSHLSILPPWQWLQYFQMADPRYRIRKVQFRRNGLAQIVVVICNF